MQQLHISRGYRARKRGIMIKFDYISNVEHDFNLPMRATGGASGYDFCAPEDVVIKAGEWVVIPTHVRWICDDRTKWLMLMPRSGYGFKYRFRLANTVGNIDSDYWHSDNEGHIMAKVTADVDMVIKKGDRFMQGVICSCAFTDDDCAEGERNGGFGSTGK